MNQNSFYTIPFNDISQYAISNLEKHLEGEFLGFVDKKREDKNIIKTESLKSKEFDKIVICSTGYYKAIYEDLVALNVPKDKILFYEAKENKIYDSLFLYDLKIKYDSFFQRPIIDNKIIDFELYFGGNCKALKSFKDKHKNKRAFILGNGPSLNLKDIEKLKDEITFAANKIYLLFNETKWRPTYYFVEDDLVFRQDYSEIRAVKDTTKFFPTFTKRFTKPINDGIYYRLLFKPFDKDFPQISTNPVSGFYWGSTVVYSMIQMALYMGIKELYIIGMDFSFNMPKEFDINSAGRKDFINENEINHFHKDYRKKGEKWNAPNLGVQKEVMDNFASFAIKNDIKIYNASRKSELTSFSRVNLDSILLESND